MTQSTTTAPSAGIPGNEQPIKLLMPTVIVGLGAVQVALSNSALNTALPTLTEVFRVSPAEIAWVNISFMLTQAVLLTVFGRLSDLTGRKRPYAIGVGLGLIGSLAAVISGGLAPLVGSRMLQGVGGSMSSANSLAYLIDIYPPQRRGFLVGAFEACIAVGLGIGPVIGGILLGAFGWQAVFLLQVPFAVAILALIPGYMKEPAKPRPANRTFDFAGAALFAGALGPVMYALTAGPRQGFGSPVVLGCFALSIISLIAFIAVEKRIAAPMVSLDMFSSKAFSAGNAAKICAYFCFASMSFLMPFYWDRALGFEPAQLGLVLTAFPVGMLTGSVVFGPLSDRMGTRTLAPAGLAIVALVGVFQAQVTADMGAWPVFAAAALGGLGVGAFIAPNDSAILSVISRDRIGVANAIMSLSRTIGSLTGSALIAGLLSARLAANNGEFVPSYHESFLVIAGVALVGAVLAWVRDPGQVDRPHHH